MRVHARAPLWDLLRDSRDQITTELSGLDGDLLNATIVVGTELVENAIKYSRSGALAELRIEATPEQIEVRLAVPLRSPESSAETIARLTLIREATDKSALYLERMKASVKSASVNLGLFRLAAETDFELTWSVEGELFTVTGVRVLRGARL